MTNEEALINFGCIRKIHKETRIWYPPREEEIDIAIEALKKSIPEQVYLEGDGEWDGRIVYDTAECSCGKKFEDGDDDWESNYCPQCGQRLKWADKNERNLADLAEKGEKQ